ncbi:MAG: hypothetical protein ACI4E1_05275 [Lachnospira sp.]
MKKILKLEMYRATHGLGFIVSMLIGTAIALAQFFIDVVPMAGKILFRYTGMLTYPKNLYSVWLGGNFSNYLLAYFTILPILIVLPYGLSLYMDNKSGYAKNVITRVEAKKYYRAKCIVNSLLGGTVAVFPLLLNFLLTATLFPALNPIGDQYLSGNSIFSHIYYKYPILTMILYFLFIFLHGAFYAVLPLAFSSLLRNLLLLSLLPFIMWYLMSFVSRYLNESIAPNNVLFIFSRCTDLFLTIVIMLVVAIGSYAMLMLKAKKGDMIV